MKGHGFSILKFCKIHIRIKCIKITLLIHLISVLNFFCLHHLYEKNLGLMQ